MVNFVLKILRKLGPKDFCEADSETLTREEKFDKKNAFCSRREKNRCKTKFFPRIMVIYGDIVVNCLRILSTKSTISHKIEIA